jgi:hypothetical protein
MKRKCLKKEEELEGESLEKRENAIGTERDGVRVAALCCGLCGRE